LTIESRTNNTANEILTLAGTTGLTIETRTNNTANEILTLAGTTGPAYDSAGNMTGDAQSHTYRYDAWNRLTAVYSDLAMTATVATYKYDGRNYRIAKTVGNDTFDYYYNTNWQVLEERKNGSRNSYAKYVWDLRYIDAPVLCWRDTNADSYLDATHYYINDANMNVTAIVNASNGNVVERTIYDAYGKPTFLDGSWNLQGGTGTASGVANEILYCGYRYNAETGNYQVRNREYQPSFGSWLQRDPAKYKDGLDLYQYCRSRPYDLVDYRGLIGAVITGADPLTTIKQVIPATMPTVPKAPPGTQEFAAVLEEARKYVQEHPAIGLDKLKEYATGKGLDVIFGTAEAAADAMKLFADEKSDSQCGAWMKRTIDIAKNGGNCSEITNMPQATECAAGLVTIGKATGPGLSKWFNDFKNKLGKDCAEKQKGNCPKKN
jgi:RHS repeat-associated protein